MNRKRKSDESGVALLVVIAGLLLITAVTAGMILMTNGETGVNANYRGQQIALFAAKAGLQEARDRMLSSNASSISLSSLITPSLVSSVCPSSPYAIYITASGVSPWSSSSSYYDSEFLSELTPASVFPTCSTWYTWTGSNSSYSGPSANPVPYQWVRINLKLDQSSYNSGTAYYVDGNSANAAQQVFYDSSSGHECVNGTGICSSSSNLFPVYEVTSFAVANDGSRRMLQDEVTPLSFNLNLKSALSIPGSVGSFSGGSSANYKIDGVNGSGSAPAVPGCTPNSSTQVPAVGVSNGTSATVVDGGTPRPANYIGGQCNDYSTPCIGTTTLPTSMDSPADLDQTVQTIKQAAQNGGGAALIPASPPGNYSFSDIVSGMPGGTWPNASTNPKLVYVDGNLDISGNNPGSGILVVTGNLTYDGNSSWNGIILVVGQGTTTFNVNGGGSGQFNGAIMVATTKDASGNELSNFGTADFNINGGGGSGIYYNTCWINYVQQPQTYLVLSSKEISH